LHSSFITTDDVSPTLKAFSPPTRFVPLSSPSLWKYRDLRLLRDPSAERLSYTFTFRCVEEIALTDFEARRMIFQFR